MQHGTLPVPPHMKLDKSRTPMLTSCRIAEAGGESWLGVWPESLAATAKVEDVARKRWHTSTAPRS